MITLVVNGLAREIDGPTALSEFLDTLGFVGRYVAVARNGDVLDRGSFHAVVLQDGDRLEIVRPVGGG
jgi:sulfur carrier protein